MRIKILLLILSFPFAIYAEEFNILTYNVAGLPKIVSKNNGQNGEKKHPLISPLLNNFDIALFQEDFAYHNLLIKDVLHPFFSTQKKSGFFRLGDGLNRLSQFPFNGFTRKKWNKCFGIFRKKSANDCLTPKGFSVASHEMGPGVFIDIYNHHGEAGNTIGDGMARKKNIKKFIKYIRNHSDGRAIILAGDFNLHESNPVHKKYLTKFLKSLNLKDACKELKCGQNNLIDKIFYRSGHGIDLKALEWVNNTELFKDDKGNNLSDHPPISVRFNWGKSKKAKRIISLRAFHSGLCLGRGRDNKAIQVDCRDKVKLEVIPTKDFSISLMDIETKTCLDIVRGSKMNRRDLIFKPCHFKNQQRFFLEDLNSGRRHYLINKYSKKCLDVYKNDENEGARVIQFKCHQGENQQWDILEGRLPFKI